MAATATTASPSAPMSNTISSAVCTCTVSGLESSSEDVALSVYDYFVNHPDEIPLDLEDCDSDEFVWKVADYISCEGDHLTIAYDSEKSNGSSEVFDLLVKHFACLQSSLFLRVNWVVEDSRNGVVSGVSYVDRQGDTLDVEAILTAHLSK